MQAAERSAETTAEDDPASRASETSEERPAPPADEFEAMRRRVHEEARAAAEEMKKSGEDR